MAEKMSEEELLARKDARKEGDGSHATSSRGHLVIEVKEEGDKGGSRESYRPQWFATCFSRLLSALPDQEMAQNDEPSDMPRIEKANPRLHEKLGDLIEPKELSFGPIHYGEEKLREGETVKKKLAAFYFLVNEEVNCFDIYGRIMEEVQSLQQCYDVDEKEWRKFCKNYRNANEDLFSSLSDSDPPSDNEIVSWMFMVDGCAVLSWIAFRCGGYRPWRLKYFDLVIKLSGLSESFHTDIFLLENQLPSKLLVTLMLMENTHQLITPVDVNVFIDNCCYKLWKVNITSSLGITDSSHLLHLFWHRMSILFTIKDDPHHFLRLWLRIFSLFKQHEQGGVSGSFRKSLEEAFSVPSHSIQELKDVGIELKAVGSTKPHHIGFKMGWLFSELQLPKFDIDDSAATMLSNLIAFEMDPHFKSSYAVTSFIVFLNSLVANPRDIAELRSAGILQNYLSSDEAALELLRGLAVNFIPRLNATFLCKWEIHNYLEQHKARTKIATWLIEAVRVYFKSPWSTIAVMAAVVAIILTAIQTYYAIFPRN